jgi:GNAT superfamily N-acetyltransferase
MILEATRDGYLVTSDTRRLNLDLVHDFLRSSYWSPGVPRDVLERAIGNSLCFGLYHDKAQVGFARVVTDKATFAYLADVFVIDGHRGRGLATWLVQVVQSHPDLQGLRRFLLATRDAHALYRGCGFAEVADPGRLMEIFRPRVYEPSA